MAYEDPIRSAQLKLAELGSGPVRRSEPKRFRIDELVGALPETAGDPLFCRVRKDGLAAPAGHAAVSGRLAHRRALL